MEYVYIDESGEPGTSSKHIIVAALVTEHDRKVAKAISTIWKAKPQFHNLNELHAHKVDDATRRRVLQTLEALEVSIYFVLIDKQKVHGSLEEAYYRAIALIAGRFHRAHVIVADRRDTDRKRIKVIQQYGLEAALRAVVFRTSHDVKQLQAVDFAAWAIGRYYEQGDISFMKLVSRIQQL